ncbi:DNA polymerase IV [Paenibacillus swuensis]|uniref:DNA polymerase IV n=1 Tax=Paenibacillus swuensis TaxID=1178515 RepID=A0A172TKP3_9BACL|nr:DNA polymerase IV [Paenibacillus swuensis]ANE47494.1 DNA polymerase IV [Paenibacillus swuensis]
MKDRVIFLVDMQSFYASVEKAARPEYRDRPLVVSGDPARRSGIVLAACPLAKKLGASTAQRLGEAVRSCPDLVVVRPRMQEYINVSLKITRIMERFTDLVEPFSIDEQFMDVTGSLALFGEPEVLAARIQDAILEETGVIARVGIGPNKILAKTACDNFAKKREGGIFWLTRERVATDMWKLPIGGLFGVGSRMRRHFERMGIHTVGDLAAYPLPRLQQLWGINGHVLWLTANGQDSSPVTPRTHEQQKAVGHQMTLPRDYATMKDIRVVLLELSEEVCRRARSKGLMGATVSAGCRGADYDHPTGFHRQMKQAQPTCSAKDVYESACKLFEEHWDGEPVRSVHVNLSQLTGAEAFQLDLFRDLERERKLDCAIDSIKSKYGTASIFKAASLTEAGQVFERAVKIGGHYK